MTVYSTLYNKCHLVTMKLFRALLVVLCFCTLLHYGTASAGPEFQDFTVSQLLDQDGWVDETCPARRAERCLPSSHTNRFRRISEQHFDLQPSDFTLQLTVNDHDARDRIYANLRLNQVDGVRQVRVRTGPRSQSVDQGMNRQQSLWSFGLMPELEVELLPRGNQPNLLRPVSMDVIFYIDRCFLDQGCDDLRTSLMVGIENGYTTQMVMHPLSHMVHQVNENLLGQVALHLEIPAVTPGANRIYLTQDGGGAAAVFNHAQSDSMSSIYELQVVSFSLNLLIVVFTGFLLAAVLYLALKGERSGSDGFVIEKKLNRMLQMQTEQLRALQEEVNVGLDAAASNSKYPNANLVKRKSNT